MAVPMSVEGREPRSPETEPRRSGAAAAARDRGGIVADEPINILIVDDEPKNLTVLRSILDCPGYRLVSAESADEALLALIADTFAVLILDVRMPGMSGFELAQIVKERKKTARVPIIFLTAYYGEDQHILDAYGVGAVDYLQKPVSAAVLRSKVAVFAELHRKTREAQLSSLALLAEVQERRRADERLRELNDTLEQRVMARTAELQDSRAQFRHAADLARLTYMSLDYSRDRIEIADNFNDIMGFALPTDGECSDAIAAGIRRLLERVSPKDRARVVAATETETVEPRQKVEYRVVGDDGRERWIESEWRLEMGTGSRPDRAFVANLDITERRQSEERRKQLMAEVNHRSKNLLSVVQSIVSQSARGADPRTFAKHLSDRLQGLSANQDLLIKNDWSGIDLSELVQAQLARFKQMIGTRILIDGPTVRLTAAGSQAMGMAIHELAANAAKYGSLSTDEGTVGVSWAVSRDADPWFRISWVEAGGPRVDGFSRRGFGHLVVGRIIESALGGTVEWEAPESGVTWKLSARVEDALQTQ